MAETKALHTVFGDYIKKIPVNATKSLVGHLLGGSGALGAACVAKTISCGEVHPSINVYNQDPECDLQIIREAKTLDIQYALANAFGFGGHNTCLVFGKYTG